MSDSDKTPIYAVIDKGRKRKLFHRLLDNDETLHSWLVKKIDEYLAPPKPKDRFRTRKEV